MRLFVVPRVTDAHPTSKAPVLVVSYMTVCPGAKVVSTTLTEPDPSSGTWRALPPSPKNFRLRLSETNETFVRNSVVVQPPPLTNCGMTKVLAVIAAEGVAVIVLEISAFAVQTTVAMYHRPAFGELIVIVSVPVGPCEL